MERRTAILRQRVCEFEGVQLNVRVAMGQAFDQGGCRLLRPRRIGRDAVAYIEDVLPVLASQVLISRFDDCASGQLSALMKPFLRRGMRSSPASSMGFCWARNMMCGALAGQDGSEWKWSNEKSQ